MANLSRTQIDKLGERLKKATVSDGDLRLLNEYRLSFSEAYASVVGMIKAKLQLTLSGRLAKSTMSIVEKLRRETIRLSQIQDIAGCRIVVLDISRQDRAVTEILGLFDETVLVDRRASPSHGYRAVHIIVKYGGKLVEVQVRTRLQHLWAELSEKLSDTIHPSLKYGGGDSRWLDLLSNACVTIARAEALEASWKVSGSLPTEKKEELARQLATLRIDLVKIVQELIAELANKEGE